MKNRAKCKLCKSIIESFHATDLVLCSCGEISVDGGEALRCGAKSWENFLRVDDDGREFSVSVKDSQGDVSGNASFKIPTRATIRAQVKEMIASYENLPAHALQQPVTHYDLVSVLLLLEASLAAES